MRRILVCGLIVLSIVFATEIRLSRSDPHPLARRPAPLWENAEPPGRWWAPPQSAGGLPLPGADPPTNCAVVISVDPNSRYTLTDASNGVAFDIDADGDRDRVAWTEPATDVAFLALDLDGDGRIASGRELIGDRTVPGVPNAITALTQLAAQSPQRGALNRDDSLFRELLLWRDVNQNGFSEAGELRPAAEELSAMGLSYEPHRRMDRHGNRSRFRGWVHVRTGPGRNDARSAAEDLARRRSMYSVCLVG